MNVEFGSGIAIVIGLVLQIIVQIINYRVSNKIHILVNSNMAVQLLLNLRVTKRLADVTKDPEDLEAAKLAEKLYKEHQAKQDAIDNTQT